MKLNKIIIPFLSCFMLIGCSKTIPDYKKIEQINLNSIDTIEGFLKYSGIDVNRLDKNQIRVNHNGLTRDFTINNNKIVKMSAKSLKPKTSNRKNSLLNNPGFSFDNEYNYNSDGLLVFANTNNQIFEMTDSPIEDGVQHDFSINGYTNLIVSNADDRITKEYSNGSRITVNKINSTKNILDFGGNDLFTIEMDSNGNVIKEKKANKIKTFSYGDSGNIISAHFDSFQYSVDPLDDDRVITSLNGVLYEEKTNVEGNFETYNLNNSVFSHIENDDCQIIGFNNNLLNYFYSKTSVGNNFSTLNSITFKENTLFSYQYDNSGNIISETDGEVTTYFVYDPWNQLIGYNCNNNYGNYEYDSRGNILLETVNNLTHTFTYGNDDLLIQFDNQRLSYDSAFNLTTFGLNNYEYTRGNVLKRFTSPFINSTFEYDSNNIRTSKTSNGERTDYYYLNGKLLYECTNNIAVRYLYDRRDDAIGFNVFGDNYFYIKDGKNDIKYIANNDGQIMVEYTYDPWGNVLNIKDNSSFNISNYNHILYKGYYYDADINMYYLMTRYYSPQLHRFITRDNLERISLMGTSDANLNLFAYANNNPVMKCDPLGYEAATITVAVGGVVIAIVVIVVVLLLYVLSSLIADFISYLFDLFKEYKVANETVEALESDKTALTIVAEEIKICYGKAIIQWLLTAWKWWDNTYRGQVNIHHIICQGFQDHAIARQWLIDYGTTYEDDCNKVELSKLFHLHLHYRKQYRDAVVNALRPFAPVKDTPFDPFEPPVAGYKLFRPKPNNEKRKENFFSVLATIKIILATFDKAFIKNL